VFLTFGTFRNTREELIHFPFGPTQNRPSVLYIYCTICNNSYRVYIAVIMTVLRSVGVAILSSGIMQLLSKGPRIFKSRLVFRVDRFVFQNKYLKIYVSITDEL
jgi:hypothetical protein